MTTSKTTNPERERIIELFSVYANRGWDIQTDEMGNWRAVKGDICIGCLPTEGLSWWGDEQKIKQLEKFLPVLNIL